MSKKLKMIVVTGDGGKTPVAMRLEQDGDDVNIYANYEILGWFGEDGRLHLMQQSDEEFEDMGFEVDDGYIQTEQE